MTNIVLLNSIEHKELKINPVHSALLGDNYMCVPTFPREFRTLQAIYPIVYGKAKGCSEYTPLVLLGLENNENLFIDNEKWNARYIPLCAECKPFLIGPQKDTGGDLGGERVIHVDLDSPKLSEDYGVSLFKDYGGSSPYLERVGETLGAIHEGVTEVQPFMKLLECYDLLEPFSVEAKLKDGRKIRVEGFYTVSEEKIMELSVDALECLQSSGFMLDIYMQVASLSQVSHLVERKNQSA